MNRKKFLNFYLPTMFVFGLIIFFSLKNYSQKNFSLEKLESLIETTSSSKDKPTDLCKYQILSEPKVGDNYIKINFWCNGDKKAQSTLAVDAIPKKTFQGVLREYSRIINFDYNLIADQQWYCLLNGQEVKSSDWDQTVKTPGNIDCYESKNLYHP